MSDPGEKGGYAALRQYHKRAYEHLSQALRIDERGDGEPRGGGAAHVHLCLPLPSQVTAQRQ